MNIIKPRGIGKFVMQAGKAEMSKLGPVLGAHGIKNGKQFCDEFNSLTKEMKGAIGCEFEVYAQGNIVSYQICKIKKKPVSTFIKEVLKLEKGSKTAGKLSVGTINHSDLRKIAEEKFQDLDLGQKNEENLHKAVKIIAGTCKSMGVLVNWEN